MAFINNPKRTGELIHRLEPKKQEPEWLERIPKVNKLPEGSAMAAAILKGSHDQWKAWRHHVTSRQKDNLIKNKEGKSFCKRLEPTKGFFV